MPNELKEIKCHQSLSGRFREGYGRIETSRKSAAKTAPETMPFDKINLEGRNNYFFHGHHAYEIEPVGIDSQYPGAFMTANTIEHGTKLAYTHGLIPCSGDALAALSMIRAAAPNLAVQRLVSLAAVADRLAELPLDELCALDQAALRQIVEEGAARKAKRVPSIMGQEELRLAQDTLAAWAAQAQQVEDAPLCLGGLFPSALIDTPFMDHAEYSLVSADRQIMTEKAVPCEMIPAGPTDFYAGQSPALRERLGRFLVEYWQLMGKRQEEAESDAAIVLSLHSGEAMDDVKAVTFFAQEIVSRYPKAVQSMISAAFGVSWSERRHFPAAACLVQLEAPDQNMVPSYDLLKDADESSRTDQAVRSKTKPGPIALAIARILMGEAKYPAVYQNMMNTLPFANPLLRSYDVLAYLVQAEQWLGLPGKTADLVRTYKNLHRFLIQCGSSEKETVCILLPLLEGILHTYTQAKEDLLADIQFFAEQRMALNEADGHDDLKAGLDHFLGHVFDVWSSEKFALSAKAQKEYPYELFLLAAQNVPWDETPQAPDAFNDCCLEILEKLDGYHRLNNLTDKALCHLLQSMYAAMLRMRGDPKALDLWLSRTASLRAQLDRNDSEQELAHTLDAFLLRYFREWSAHSFQMSGEKERYPATLLISLARAWMDQPHAADLVQQELAIIDRVEAHLVQEYQPVIEQGALDELAPSIVKVICALKGGALTREDYEKQRDWLDKFPRAVDEKTAFFTLLPMMQLILPHLAEKDAALVGGHYAKAQRFNLEDQTLIGNEQAYLLEHFSEYVAWLNASGGKREQAADLHVLVDQWQKGAMPSSTWPVEKLLEIERSLSSLGSAAAGLDINPLRRQIAYQQLTARLEALQALDRPEGAALCEIAGQYRQLHAFRDHTPYAVACNSAEDLLVQHFAAWSEEGFAFGGIQPGREGRTDPLLKGIAEAYAMQAERQTPEQLSAAQTALKKVPASILGEERDALLLRLKCCETAMCPTPDPVVLCELAGCYAKLRGAEKDEKDGPITPLLAHAKELLCEHFHAWSQGDFKFGSSRPDALLAELAQTYADRREQEPREQLHDIGEALKRFSSVLGKNKDYLLLALKAEENSRSEVIDADALCDTAGLLCALKAPTPEQQPVCDLAEEQLLDHFHVWSSAGFRCGNRQPDPAFAAFAEKYAERRDQEPPEHLQEVIGVWKSLPGGIFGGKKDALLLALKVAECEKADRIAGESLCELAGMMQNAPAGGSEDQLRARELLLTYFYEWSKEGFRYGLRQPEAGFADLAESFLNAGTGCSSEQLTEIRESLLSALKSAPKNQTARCAAQMDALLFSQLAAECNAPSARSREKLEKLAAYFTDYNDERTEQIYASIDKSADAGLEGAEPIARDLLDKCGNRVPDNRLSVFVRLRKENILNAFQQVLSGGELITAQVRAKWEDQWQERMHCPWEQLDSQLPMEDLVRSQVKAAADRADRSKQAALLLHLMEQAGESHGKGYSGTLFHAAAAEFDVRYDSWWKQADREGRDKLEHALAELCARSDASPLLKHSKDADSQKAAEFIQTFRALKGSDLSELGGLFLQMRKPSAWKHALRQTDLPEVQADPQDPDRIRLALLRDLALSQAEDAAYWESIFRLVVGCAPGELQRNNPWKASAGMRLNALVYLCEVMAPMGEGGTAVLDDLAAYLTEEAPQFVRQLTDAKTISSLYWWRDSSPKYFREWVLSINHNNRK